MKIYFWALKMSVITLALCIVILSALTVQENQRYLIRPKIIGGSPADIKDYPYQVSLQIWNGLAFIPYCGGSILNLRFIITAAHCLYLPTETIGKFELVSNDLLRVVAGSNDSFGINIRGQRILVKQVILHENYVSGKFNNDIALLELVKELNMTEYAKAIPLRSNATTTGEMCTISGWGLIEYARVISKGNKTRQLLQTYVPIVSHDDCNEVYHGRVSKNMICAGYAQGGKDACQGDSGGPMVCSGKLTGIVSFGDGCGKANYPGVYTRVASYLKWIESKSSGYKNLGSFKFLFVLFIFYILNHYSV